MNIQFDNMCHFWEKSLLWKCLSLNIVALIAISLFINIEYCVYVKKTKQKHLASCEKLKSRLEEDISLITAFVSLKAAENGKRSYIVQNNHFLKNALKIYIPEVIRVQSLINNTSSNYTNLNSAFYNKNLKILVYREFIHYKITSQFSFSFYFDEFVKRARFFLSDEDIIFLLKAENAPYLGHHQSIEAQKTFAHEIFEENGLKITAYPKLIIFTDFFVNKQLKSVLIICFFILYINIGYIFLFRNEKFKMHILFKNELTKSSKLVEEQNHAILSLKEAQEKQRHLKEGIERSYKAFERETFYIWHELREYMQHIGSYCKMVECVDDEEALREVLSMVDKFDIEQLSDTSKEEELNIFTIIENAIDLNLCILQMQEIDLIKKYSIKSVVVYGNALILIRILSSILYNAIQASVKQSKIFIDISRKKIDDEWFMVLVIRDSGYRISQGGEPSTKKEQNFFKLTMEDVLKIITASHLKLECEKLSSAENICKLYVPVQKRNNKDYAKIIPLFKR